VAKRSDCGRRLQALVLRVEVEVLKQRIDYYRRSAIVCLIASAVFLPLALAAVALGESSIPLATAGVVNTVGCFILGAYCRYKKEQLQKQLEELLCSA